MANNQSTFIQLPMDVTNPLELRRFLDKLVQQVDIAFGHRGSGGFASTIPLAEVINTLNEHSDRLDNIEPIVTQITSDVNNLKNGELIVNTTTDIIVGVSTETILCDCSVNDIQVTLPNPSLAFNTSRSKTISISKIDSSTNYATILPYSSETIASQTSINLVKESEVINLVTDGLNWYLGA